MTTSTSPGRPEDYILSADTVSFSYRSPKVAPGPNEPGWVLKEVSVGVRQGEFLALVGINGCGKSTLLQVLSGQINPRQGSVSLKLAGQQVKRLSEMSARSIARTIAVMHQVLPPMPGVTVSQLVDQGHYPHRGALAMLSRPSGSGTRDAIQAVGMTALADRLVDTLSGGERQRARLALALAQQGKILLLDEPTAHLDIRHQLEMLALIKHLQQTHGLTVIMVIHDLDQAARFADRILALTNGEITANGPPAQVLTPELLAQVFGVRGRVVRDASTDRLHCFLDEPLPVNHQTHLK